jgi:hypothetical protein
MNGVHVHLVAHPRKGLDERRPPGKIPLNAPVNCEAEVEIDGG